MKNKLDNFFTHINKENNPKMMDISNKNITKRSATAKSLIYLPKIIWKKLNNGEIISKKGPVINTAIIAGVMAVKNTSNLIPFCHTLCIENCEIKVDFNKNQTILIKCIVDTTSKTGAEMEALTGASIAALTIYDMCKAMSYKILIKKIYLEHKTGGKSDFKQEKS